MYLKLCKRVFIKCFCSYQNFCAKDTKGKQTGKRSLPRLPHTTLPIQSQSSCTRDTRSFRNKERVTTQTPESSSPIPATPSGSSSGQWSSV